MKCPYCGRGLICSMCDGCDVRWQDGCVYKRWARRPDESAPGYELGDWVDVDNILVIKGEVAL